MSDIDVTAEPFYLAEQSEPNHGRHVFAYRIRIRNRGDHTVQLLDRHWFVDHGDGHVEEVRGEGVVGEKPRLAPGRVFEYTSGAVIRTPAGAMHGEYGFATGKGERFTVTIPRFDLIVPRDLRTLH
ncbi:MAG: Co2+/Mg2+ efflux protein ApaG [Halothiobacillaceae bacterium]